MLKANGSISSDIASNRRSSQGMTGVALGSTQDLNESGSATQSVSEHDDMSSLTNKFKALRRENI